MREAGAEDAVLICSVCRRVPVYYHLKEDI